MRKKELKHERIISPGDKPERRSFFMKNTILDLSSRLNNVFVIRVIF